MIIDSKIHLGKQLRFFTQEQIKNEPMFFNSHWEFAYQHGNELTKEFLNNLPVEIKTDNLIIDSRVHMLMKGWFPCIPGFHHDDVPREGKNGQPEYYKPSYKAKHAMVLFNGNICPTEFALGNTVFSRPELHEIVYKEWHKEVIDKLNNEELNLFKAPDSQIIFFDDRTWHQGNKAVDNGWRCFIRASWDTGRKLTNEIRKQVQVYLENPMEGW